jgi:hypothetical protein
MHYKEKIKSQVSHYYILVEIWSATSKSSLLTRQFNLLARSPQKRDWKRSSSLRWMQTRIPSGPLSLSRLLSKRLFRSFTSILVFVFFLFFCFLFSRCCSKDPNQDESRAVVAASVGIDREQVVCGAGGKTKETSFCCQFGFVGSDDILEIIIRAFKLSTVLVSSPTFSMYSFLARLNVPSVAFVDVPRKSADFSLDVPALITAIRSYAIDKDTIPLLFIASPNNPTGTYLTHDEARVLLKERCIVVIDEAYIDFAEIEVRNFCFCFFVLLKIVLKGISFFVLFVARTS